MASIASIKLRNPALASGSRSMMVKTSRSERESRSSFRTTSTSPLRSVRPERSTVSTKKRSTKKTLQVRRFWFRILSFHWDVWLRKGIEMTRLKMGTWFVAFLGVLFVCAGSACATDISGTITTTLTVMDNSKLVGDVTCTVTGAPCLSIGAPNVTLDLNGFTMTGQADAQTACSGAPSTFVPTALEDGIDLNAQTDVAIRGPGVIQQFRGPGIFLNNSRRVTVTGVTTSTNCLSGILVGGGSDNEISGNNSVANGNGTFPCGGI